MIGKPDIVRYLEKNLNSWLVQYTIPKIDLDCTISDDIYFVQPILYVSSGDFRCFEGAEQEYRVKQIV